MPENKVETEAQKKKPLVFVGSVPINYYADYISLSSLPYQTAWKSFQVPLEDTVYSLAGAVQVWPVVQEWPKEAEIEPSVEIDESEILEKARLRLIISKITNVSRQLEKMEDKFDKHDTETTQQLKRLVNENDELKKILSYQYPAKSLLHFSVTASLALLSSLFVWLQFGVVIVHPALAIIGLIGTVGFSALAIWRKKDE